MKEGVSLAYYVLYYRHFDIKRCDVAEIGPFCLVLIKKFVWNRISLSCSKLNSFWVPGLFKGNRNVCLCWNMTGMEARHCIRQILHPTKIDNDIWMCQWYCVCHTPLQMILYTLAFFQLSTSNIFGVFGNKVVFLCRRWRRDPKIVCYNFCKG